MSDLEAHANERNIVGPNLSRPFAWNHNNVGTCCVYVETGQTLRPIETGATWLVNSTQHWTLWLVVSVFMGLYLLTYGGGANYQERLPSISSHRLLSSPIVSFRLPSSPIVSRNLPPSPTVVPDHLPPCIVIPRHNVLPSPTIADHLQHRRSSPPYHHFLSFPIISHCLSSAPTMSHLIPDPTSYHVWPPPIISTISHYLPLSFIIPRHILTL